MEPVFWTEITRKINIQFEIWNNADSKCINYNNLCMIKRKFHSIRFSQGRIQEFHFEGGGGGKRLCARTHITSAKELEALGFLMLSYAI